MSAGRLRVDKRGAVGWIVFDQPAKMNAINDAMWRAIPEAMARFDADREVRCVAFRGDGTQAFAAGADISQFEEIRDGQAAVGEYDDLLDRVLHSIQDSRKPSVALIHGFCMGGGLEVALACDLRYCGELAQFAIPAAKLGPTTSRGTSGCWRRWGMRARGRSCFSAAATGRRKRWRWGWCIACCPTPSSAPSWMG